MKQKMIINHTKWMSEALEVAKSALKLKEVPVGCIILDENETIIGRGHNMTNLKKNPTRHAEFESIDQGKYFPLIQSSLLGLNFEPLFFEKSFKMVPN